MTVNIISVDRFHIIEAVEVSGEAVIYDPHGKAALKP